MGSLWESKTYSKNSAKFCRGLDLSKEVDWASVHQRLVKLQAVKVEGLKKNLPLGLLHTVNLLPGFNSQKMESSSKFDKPQFTAVWPKEFLRKDWNLLKNILPTHKTGRILKIVFSLSHKLNLLHRAHSLSRILIFI